MTAPVLRIENLSVEIRRDGRVFRPVRDISLSVDAGETLGIAGESGSGKSMTLMSVLSLLPIGAALHADAIEFDSVSLLGLPRRALNRFLGSSISMVFQDPMTCLNPVLSVGAQLQGAFLRHRGGPRRAARERAIELLDRVGIPDARQRLKQFPYELSGGLRQRVMIAMSLMCGPKLLMADEPTTALDVTVQAGILDLLDELQRDFGLSVIIVSHDLGVIARNSTRVAIMYAGQIVEMGRTADILDAPRHPCTEALINCTPDIHGSNARLLPIPGRVPDLSVPQAGCSFAARCRFADGICSRSSPPIMGNALGSFARCHFTAETLHSTLVEGHQ